MIGTCFSYDEQNMLSLYGCVRYQQYQDIAQLQNNPTGAGLSNSQDGYRWKVAFQADFRHQIELEKVLYGAQAHEKIELAGATCQTAALSAEK